MVLIYNILSYLLLKIKCKCIFYRAEVIGYFDIISYLFLYDSEMGLDGANTVL